MGSVNLPAQPDAPDYAAANREAIYTDIETLPIRRQLDSAARAGKKLEYQDPQTGETKVADFSGLGDLDFAKGYADLLLKSNEDIQRGQLSLREALGESNAKQTAKEIRAADPNAADTRDMLTIQLLSDLRMPKDQIDADKGVLSAASRFQDQQTDPRLGNLYAEADRLYNPDVKDSSTAALNVGLQKALEDFQLGGKLDEATRREITDNVRAGQAARGNFLGDSASVVETLELGSAAEKRKADRLAALLDVQGRAFGQNSSLRNERNAVIGAKLATQADLQSREFSQGQSILANALQAAQAAAGETRTARNETYAREQQKKANASAFVLGQPVTNQFGSLAAAQNGAVGFTPVQQQTIGANGNAGQLGAQWAQNNYSQATNMWNTQANIAAQGSPWMALLGNVAGGIAGGVGAGLGGAAAAAI